jgi:hypothetical protein
MLLFDVAVFFNVYIPIHDDYYGTLYTSSAFLTGSNVTSMNFEMMYVLLVDFVQIS